MVTKLQISTARSVNSGIETANTAQLPALFEAARANTAAALGALTKADSEGYRHAKHGLPMLAAAVFNGPRSARNVEKFAVCFVEFDELAAPLGRVWAAVRAAAPEVEGLLAAWATGRGVRFLFAVPPVDGHAADLTRELYRQVWQRAADLLAARFPLLGKPDASSAKPEQLQAVWARADFVPYLNLDAPALPFGYAAETAREWLSNAAQRTQNAETDANTPLTFEAYSTAVATAETWPAAETHEGWLGFVAAMARTFGPQAEDLTAALCRRAAGYDTDSAERKTRRLFRRVLTAPAPAGRKAGAGTLIYAARLAGCTPPVPERAGTAPEPLQSVTLNVKRHVTEAAAELAALIDGHEGLTLVKSPTGAGKTRWAADWLKANAYAGAEIGALVMPYTEGVLAVADREKLPYVAEGVSADVLGEDFDGGARVFVCTFDGLAKLRKAGLIVSRAVVDETHALPNACTYRAAAREVLPLLGEVLGRNGRAVLMTATPPPELLLTLRADVADVLTVDVLTEAAAETGRLIFDGAGTRADLINYICAEADPRRRPDTGAPVHEPRRVIVHVDRKADPLTRRGVYELAAQLRRRGLTVATATAERPEGIEAFKAGTAQVLIGTRIVCESYDVPAEGRECVAVSVCTKGVEAELLAQLGGRFRNAKRVNYVCWAWGAGAYLDDYSKRESAAKGAEPFNLLATFNAARRRADRYRADTLPRKWAQLGTLNAPAVRGIEEREGRAAIDPLAVAAEAMQDRARLGGLPAALPLLADWLPEAEYAGSLIFDGEDRADLPATEFETFSKAATAALKHVNPADFVRLLLARAEAEGGESAEAARRFANRYALVAPTCPLTALRVALMDVAKSAERAAVRKVEASEGHAPKVRRRAERNAARWAEFVRLLNGTNAEDLLADWAEGWAAAADRIWAWLLSLPPQASKADVMRIVSEPLADGLTESKAANARRRYGLLYAVAAGIENDIPAEVLADLPRAEYLHAARTLADALPRLIEGAKGTKFTAPELGAFVREWIGCTLAGKQLMTLLRALADVEAVTVTEGNRRTTKYVVTRAVSWADLGLSFAPREAVEAHLLNAAAKAEREGVPEDRIFRLLKARKMHGPPSLSEPPAPVLNWADGRPIEPHILAFYAD